MFLKRVVVVLAVVLLAGIYCVAGVAGSNAAGEEVFPAREWEIRAPEELGLSRAKLDALRDLVGGRGCVVRHGRMAYQWGDQARSADVASAMKPVLSIVMLMAVQEKRIGSVDEPIARFEKRLAGINGGKDAAITWRHLAMQTSGYGLIERPGEAYSYNDFALALYYDTLMHGVYQEDGTSVFRKRLGEPLRFQDDYTFEAFGPNNRPGRLAMSVRDFARVGLLVLRGGRWGERQVLDPALLKLALSSPLLPDTPRTSGREADMLPRQRSLGGTRNITPVGPGYYSFNWWLNGKDQEGRRLFVDAPSDAFVASGHGGIRTLWVVPSLDLIVSWNDAAVEDHDASPGNPGTKCNRAVKLMCEAIIDAEAQRPRTRISIAESKWRINGEVTYRGSAAEGLLMNVRMVNAVFEDRNRPDFDAEANTDRFIAQIPAYVASGVRAFTLCLQGGYPGYEGAVNSAFEPDGSLREAYLDRVRRVIEACDRQGAAVILGCYYQRQDQVLRDEAAVRAGLIAAMRWVEKEGFSNVVVEVANEFPHDGFNHAILKDPGKLAELIRAGRAAVPGVLISASGIGDGKLADDVAKASDFLLIHFNGVPVKEIPSRVEMLRRWGKPIVCNEDDKLGEEAAAAAAASVKRGASWGFMMKDHNQGFPFRFDGPADDLAVYTRLKELTAQRGPEAER